MKIFDKFQNKILVLYNDSWIKYSIPLLAGVYISSFLVKEYYKIPLGSDVSNMLWGFYLLYAFAKWQGIKEKKKEN